MDEDCDCVSEQASFEDKEAHSVAFYNYIQESVGVGPRPTPEMWGNAREPFNEVTSIYRRAWLPLVGRAQPMAQRGRGHAPKAITNPFGAIHTPKGRHGRDDASIGRRIRLDDPLMQALASGTR